MAKSTRRKFIQTAGTGILAGTLLTNLNGCAKPEKLTKKDGSKRIHLGMASYTFRKFGLEETISMTRRLGLTRIALKNFHLPLDSSDDEIKQAAQKVRDAGLDLYGCGVVYMKNEAEVHNAFRYAGAAGMKVIIGVPEHELLKLVEQKVKESNIKVAIHNHGPGDERYPTPQSVYEKIKDLDPRVGLCVDVGHTQRSGIDPADVIAMYADRVLDIHLKDVSAATKAGGTVEIGRGIIDIPKLLQTLLQIKYTGTASFEFEKDSADPLPGVAESVGYVRGVLTVI